MALQDAMLGACRWFPETHRLWVLLYMYCVLKPTGAQERKDSLPPHKPEAAVPGPSPHRKGEMNEDSPCLPLLSEIGQRMFNDLPSVLRAPTVLPQARTLGGSCNNSPHICPIALANLKGKPDEMFGEVARADAR